MSGLAAVLLGGSHEVIELEIPVEISGDVATIEVEHDSVAGLALWAADGSDPMPTVAVLDGDRYEQFDFNEVAYQSNGERYVCQARFIRRAFKFDRAVRAALNIRAIRARESA